MTDQELANFYAETLRRLLDLGAGELVRDIEITVARGCLRTKVGGKTGPLQSPLAPREALVVALRMLVAAVEPPLHVQAAQEVLGGKIVWGFDELEPWPSYGDAGTASLPGRASTPLESPGLPDLSGDAMHALRAGATALLELVGKLEEHDNADAG